jgi:hypothetical protein
MTGTNCDLFTHKPSRSYLNHLVLQKGKQKWNILYTTKRWKANWIGGVLRRNCLPKHVTEGKILSKDRKDWKTRKKT